MERIRKPFQGILNIIRFNWHFYFLSLCGLVLLLVLKNLFGKEIGLLVEWLIIIVVFSISLSLVVSFFIYDLSNLYKLDWLDGIIINPQGKAINIHAGFDETSNLLQENYPSFELIVFDFYDPLKHTEISIKRARKAYPPYKGTKQISTNFFPLPNDSIDAVFVILSAHEIRNDEERAFFFKEITRVLKASGKIIVVEHLRDLPNFLAYSIGAFHFLSRSTWLKTFVYGDLNLQKEIKINPFMCCFILKKNGTTT